MDIGERIKARRKEIGLSAEQVAEKLGVSPATIYRYESNDILNMRIDKLEPIAKVLKTSPAYLMGWEEFDIEENIPADNELDEDIKKAEKLIDQLSSENLDKIIDYMTYLLNSQDKE